MSDTSSLPRLAAWFVISGSRTVVIALSFATTPQELKIAAAVRIASVRIGRPFNGIGAGLRLFVCLAGSASHIRRKYADQ